MTVTSRRTTVVDELRRAAVRATWAHSVYDTQPWQLRLTGETLVFLADSERQMRVADPVRRQLLISLGCAVFNARVSLAASGLAGEVRRLPDARQTELVAALSVSEGKPDAALAALDSSLETRYSDQRFFFDDVVPDQVLDVLSSAADAEGAQLYVVADAGERADIAALDRHASAIESLNPAHRAEVRAWTAGRAASGMHAGGVGSAAEQTLAVLCTDGDSARDWVVAGEALERVLLEIARAGYAARVLTQVTEVPSVRAQLNRDLALPGDPHLLLRIGRAPVAPVPRRRRLVEVLREED